ncbi:MAG: response regulator [Porticoccaceae bacterium]|nr:response regulator [Porticoccaceae bacterium]
MKKTILVVENKTLSRTIIVRILEFHGLHCIAAENGQQALELLTISHCDLILTDLRMPVVDGVEFIKIVRKREKLIGNKPIPIVVLSAERGDMVNVAKEYGISDCFVKSAPFDKLVPKLKRLLGEIVWDRQRHPH